MVLQGKMEKNIFLTWLQNMQQPSPGEKNLFCSYFYRSRLKHLCSFPGKEAAVSRDPELKHCTSFGKRCILREPRLKVYICIGKREEIFPCPLFPGKEWYIVDCLAKPKAVPSPSSPASSLCRGVFPYWEWDGSSIQGVQFLLASC